MIHFRHLHAKCIFSGIILPMKKRRYHTLPLREQIRQKPKLFVVYLLLRLSVVGVMVAQIFNRDWHNVALCLLTLFLMFSRYGDIKFGGQDAQPEYSYWNWFAMTLCAGIAIGVVFWGAAEPVMQFMNPPKSLGITPFSEEAARFSLAQIFLEWTLTPYAMYTVCGISCAYAFYNMKAPRTISSAFIPIFGERMKGFWGQILDAFIIFSAACGMNRCPPHPGLTVMTRM